MHHTEEHHPRLAVRPFRMRINGGSHDGWIMYHLQLGLDLPTESFNHLLDSGWQPVRHVPGDELGLENTVSFYTFDESVAFETLVDGADAWATTQMHDACIDPDWRIPR